MRVFERARKLEQLIRIAGSRDPAVQDGIVRGALTLSTQTGSCKPRERMEPIEAASQLGANLHEPVMTRDMCEFVRKHGFPPLRRPFHCARGKQNSRSHNSPGHRHRRDISGLQHLHATRDSQLPGDPRNNLYPIITVYGRASRRDPCQSCQAYEQLHHHKQSPEYPEKQNQLGQLAGDRRGGRGIDHHRRQVLKGIAS